jgi:hypothetical protein
MDDRRDMKFLIFGIWILSVIGSAFFGHEAALMLHRIDKEVANIKLQNCHQALVGEMYQGREGL